MTEPLFTPIEGAQAVISNRGVYMTVPIYHYRERLYVAVKAGFIQLKAGESTSVYNVMWRAVEGVAYVEEYNGLRLANAPEIQAQREVAHQQTKEGFEKKRAKIKVAA